MTSFYKYYLNLCRGIGKTPAQVNRDIGLSSCAHNFWKNDGKPRDSTLERIADYFDMEPADLLKEFEGDPKVKHIKKSDDLDELVNLYRHASPILRKAAIAVLKSGMRDELKV